MAKKERKTGAARPRKVRKLLGSIAHVAFACDMMKKKAWASHGTTKKLRTCLRVEDVRSVLTLIRRGAAQVCHVLRVEELGEQLEVEEGDGDRQEEEEEVESGEVESRRVRHVDDHGWR